MIGYFECIRDMPEQRLLKVVKFVIDMLSVLK